MTDLSGPDAATAAASAREALRSSRLDVLVVVGGDGMAHLGTNLVAGTGIPLAIVAAGTGNDNARELGLPLRDARAASASVTAGHTRSVDAGRCNPRAGEDRWWLGVLGGGFDSVVAERAGRMTWPRGPLRYNLAIARELPTFRPIPYVVTVDDLRIETEAMLVAVANGPAFGGGMRVAPDASYEDGAVRRDDPAPGLGRRLPARLPPGLLRDAHDPSAGADPARPAGATRGGRHRHARPTASASSRCPSTSRSCPVPSAWSFPRSRSLAAWLGLSSRRSRRPSTSRSTRSRSQACTALEDGHGVLVAAPTGAGKTVVGEFAVHLALASGRKAFYTTPIKALSNQKYADLVRRHGASERRPAHRRLVGQR